MEKLLEDGHQARVLDLNEPPFDGPETISGSVTDLATVERAIEGCDAVIHLAAAANVDEVERDPALAESVNVRGTLNVLEAARNARVKRVVYASTTWAYSDCRELEVNEDTVPAAPSHLYTATKLAGEMYCRSYAELYGLEFTILRFGIPYGPRARNGGAIVIVGPANPTEQRRASGGSGAWFQVYDSLRRQRRANATSGTTMRAMLLGSGTVEIPTVTPLICALPVQVGEGAPQPVDKMKSKVSVIELVGPKLTSWNVDPGSPVRGPMFALPVLLKLMVPVPVKIGDSSSRLRSPIRGSPLTVEIVIVPISSETPVASSVAM